MDMHRSYLLNCGMVAVLVLLSVFLGGVCAQNVDSCHDHRGYDVEIGEQYNPSQDTPCVRCTCRLQFRPPGDIAGCMTVQCARPDCDNYISIEGECCGYKCPDIDVGVPQPVINDNGTENVGQPWCKDFRGFTVTVGQRYNPSYTSPCIDCECTEAPRDPGDYMGCMTASCAAPPGCIGKKIEQIPGECCGFRCAEPDEFVSVEREEVEENHNNNNNNGHFNQNIDSSEEEFENRVPIIPRVNDPIRFPGNNPVVRPPLGNFPAGRNVGMSYGFRDLLTPCCEAGRSWYDESREQCPKYSGEIASGTAEQKTRCRQIIDVCCIQEKESRQCFRGISTARIQRDCATFHRQTDREDATECCTCCLLGLDASSIGVSCTAMNYGNFSARCGAAFTECCNGAVFPELPPTTTAATLPVTLDANDTITETTNSSMDSNDTTTENPDDNLHLCRQFQGQLCAHVCIDTPGSYKCACREGFELHSDHRTCRQQTHQNRCDMNNPCDHLCVDTGTALNCKCFDGYRLTNDGFTCDDIDECIEGTHSCFGRQSCANTEGSFTCVGPVGGNEPTPTRATENCDVGFAFNSVTRECEDIDECIINRFTCEPTEECINNEGSYRCRPTNGRELECGTGFYFNSDTGTCDDLNECELGTHRCTELNQKCRNTVGSFICSCDTGYIYNRRTSQCEDINECALNYDTCMFGQTCVNNAGSYVCRRTVSCGTGYVLDDDSGICEDINECALNYDTCMFGQTCVNNAGSYVCRRTVSCGTGYVLDDDSGICEDIDECQYDTHDCGPSKECRNIPGSFRCMAKNCPLGYTLNADTGRCDALSCEAGYEPNMQGNCVDVNECNSAVSPCRPNQECRNTVGSFTCRNLLQCGPGFELNELGNRCIDVNECVRGTHDCNGHRMRCVNRRGTYICQCPEGYQMNSVTRRCDDIDECNSPFGGNVCDLNARCENSEGSFRCICNEGFENEGSYCKDINECDRPGMCQHTCRNTRGSFQCSCFEGYQLGSDSRTCEDVDECSVWAQRGGQLCLGNCVNTQGSYRCECPDGYRMDPDGRTCQDVDECVEKTADCYGEHEHCINTRGGFKCESVQCPKGFIKAPSLNNRNKFKTAYGVDNRTTPYPHSYDYSRDGLHSLTGPLPLIPADDESWMACMREECPLADVDCILNTTRTIQWLYVALPTVPVLPHMLSVVTMQTEGTNVFPNVRFRLLDGNGSGKFDVQPDTGYPDRGSLRLIQPVIGPKEYNLRLRMDHRNAYDYIISSHIAFVRIYISRYPY